MSLKPFSALMTEGQVIERIKTVFDPEIPVDIYELGLIYNIDVRDDGVVRVEMTLTSPMCPVADHIPVEVKEKVMAIEGVEDVIVDLVWEPPWSVERMSEAARLDLGFW